MTDQMTADPVGAAAPAGPATAADVAGAGPVALPAPARLVTAADVEEAMLDVVDPELGINVVDLGLVYGVTLEQAGDGMRAVLDMTLTSAACPLTDVIEDQARDALGGLVADMRINWVWMPPWGPDKITPSGREQLKSIGFNI